ncbi:LytR/AlgR family response regulator transcription factor [Flavobacterium johnsoniae]|jgi:DNA-binding LytR/AlgR family response regulator|uniref:Two component transcriptional regulator, LytTR family n=1 Tax=Flavobacterium johnsoniae (strain ATCC 17061 / DSM 2064 / JCM 8514 / BCRC 14874 / CCUG 350202 / NBRC 14942 / NCIMB 11054 / UW101) TaxID=376686 RepID=A5FJA4_FLAJ1|nr:LytTR family DNA-binding domain-containing protein [Flavobacterium johnsoniae]ABQ04711.1 two component transcriptional regulator, LytTR family [Flavobacterium johnsoniae UW101]OXE96445.1 DNA-binding response regulator [Flavobacterium johnsoniae UW101]WQG83492.1 LytTR family DNA-binding domain-containing protein [Flavobacterium johnsoniae UW101]SHK31200.1 two component transcriptional regulator, LytTR family [Flavobacterium johnsoniae]
MKCVIIDDEPLAVELLEDFVKKVDSLELVNTFNNAIDAVSFINQNNIDLIFLDIQMPHFSGIEFINTIEKKPLVIFTTAYSDYAVEGFNLGAVDYLVKPIPFHRFLKSVVRAQQINNPAAPVQAVSENVPAPEVEQDFMFVRAEYENVKMNFSDILFIEGLKDYVKIYTTDNKFTLTLISLIKLENLLSNKGFSRIHRSYIINIKHVKSIQKNKVLISDKRIPISESYKNAFFEKINL